MYLQQIKTISKDSNFHHLLLKMDKLKYNTVQKHIIQKIAANMIQEGSQKGYDTSALLRHHEYNDKLHTIDQTLFNDNKRKMYMQAHDILLTDLSAQITASNKIIKMDKIIKQSISKLKQSQQHVDKAIKRIQKEVDVCKTYDETMSEILSKRLLGINRQCSLSPDDMLPSQLIKPVVSDVVHRPLTIDGGKCEIGTIEKATKDVIASIVKQ